MNPPVDRSSPPTQARTDGWTNAAIIRTACILTLVTFALFVLWRASEILLLVFLGVLFGLAVADGANRLARWRIPRGVGAALIVLSTVLALFGVASYVGPTLAEQTATIRQSLPAALDRADRWLEANAGTSAGDIIRGAPGGATDSSGAAPAAKAAKPSGVDIANQLGNGIEVATGFLFGFLSSSLTVLAGIGLMFVLAVYVGAEADLYRRGLLSLFPPAMRPRAAEVLTATGDTLRKWLRTQFIAMLVIGGASFIAFRFIGVQAAFALALIAGLLEFIPTLGPIISGAIAVSMAFLDSPSKALAVLIAAIAIQQAENQILIPLLMKGGLDLPPALTIVSQAVMAILFGFAGMLVAVPLLAAIIVPVRMLYVQDALGGPVPAAGAEAAGAPPGGSG